jgi:two-component system sensor histidine kinase KdpD
MSGVIFLGAFLNSWIGYRAVGFIFLLGVLAVGLLTSMGPTIFAAVLGAFAWNFIFIPPRYTIHVDQPEDFMMILTYFVVAITMGYLANRVKSHEKRLREADMLRESEKLHQTLLDSISHELRTPLTVVMASATTLTNPEIQKEPEVVEAMGRELLGASDRLNRVIENLLDMSRLNSGFLSLKLEWQDVQDLIGVTVQKMKLQLQNRMVEMSLDENLPMIKIDFRLMEHAISNLLQNAVMYSPPGTLIRIEAKVRDQNLFLSIEDQGPGLSIDVLEKIFQKFYRVPGSPSGGTGLGLSIVKSIVEAHGGHVLASNRQEGGARFCIELPVEKMKNFPQEEKESSE